MHYLVGYLSDHGVRVLEDIFITGFGNWRTVEKCNPSIIRMRTNFSELGIQNVLIYQQKNRASILRMKLASDVLWAVHYLMISAYTAVAVACLGILREIVFMKRKRLSSLIAFLILGLVSAVVTWKGWLSLLPTMASMLSVVSFFLGVPFVSRIASFPISALICNEILTIIIDFPPEKESSAEN